MRQECAEGRAALEAAFGAIRSYETELLTRLLHGLQDLTSISVLGISDLSRMAERVPTVSFRHETHSANHVARFLAERGIFVWSGNFYAQPLSEALELEPDGMVRIGLLHYNTEEEVDRLIEALVELD